MPRDGEEIGLVEMPVRRKRANISSAPQHWAPASAPIEPVETPVRKRRASDSPTPMDCAPGVSPPKTVEETVKDLVSLGLKRRTTLKMQIGMDQRITSMIALSMGFQIDATEKERKAVFERAKAFRLAVEKGGEGHMDRDTHQAGALSAIVPLILANTMVRKPLDDIREDIEEDMAKLVPGLPVYDFAKSVKGFGDVSLAKIVAEARIPIGDYRTVNGFWMAMELGVINGERQQKKAGHKYGGERRAVAWVAADSMFKHQWRGERDVDEDGNDPEKTGKPVFRTIEAHAKGPYGEVYARRKAHTTPFIAMTADLPDYIGERFNPEKWTPSRCDRDARRIMTKALLRDLWRVWRGMPPRGAAEADGDAQ